MLVDRINFLTYLNDKQNWIETPQLCIHTKLVLVFSITWLPDVRVQTATIKTNELTSNKISDHLKQPHTCLTLINDSIKKPIYGRFTNYKKGDCAKLQNDLQSFNGFIKNFLMCFFLFTAAQIRLWMKHTTSCLTVSCSANNNINHNYIKILKSDWSLAGLISAIIVQLHASCACKWTVVRVMPE